jgi:hypothetical protein
MEGWTQHVAQRAEVFDIVNDARFRHLRDVHSIQTLTGQRIGLFKVEELRQQLLRAPGKAELRAGGYQAGETFTGPARTCGRHLALLPDPDQRRTIQTRGFSAAGDAEQNHQSNHGFRISRNFQNSLLSR